MERFVEHLKMKCTECARCFNF